MNVQKFENISDMAERTLKNGARKTSKPTFAAIKNQIKEVYPDISASKLKQAAEAEMSRLERRGNALATAALTALIGEGYSFSSITETELKSGRKKASIVVEAPAPKKLRLSKAQKQMASAMVGAMGGQSAETVTKAICGALGIEPTKAIWDVIDAPKTIEA